MVEGTGNPDVAAKNRALQSIQYLIKIVAVVAAIVAFALMLNGHQSFGALIAHASSIVCFSLLGSALIGWMITSAMKAKLNEPEAMA